MFSQENIWGRAITLIVIVVSAIALDRVLESAPVIIQIIFVMVIIVLVGLFWSRRHRNRKGA